MEPWEDKSALVNCRAREGKKPDADVCFSQVEAGVLSYAVDHGGGVFTEEEKQAWRASCAAEVQEDMAYVSGTAWGSVRGRRCRLLGLMLLPWPLDPFTMLCRTCAWWILVRGSVVLLASAFRWQFCIASKGTSGVPDRLCVGICSACAVMMLAAVFMAVTLQGQTVKRRRVL